MKRRTVEIPARGSPSECDDGSCESSAQKVLLPPTKYQPR